MGPPSCARSVVAPKRRYAAHDCNFNSYAIFPLRMCLIHCHIITFLFKFFKCSCSVLHFYASSIEMYVFLMSCNSRDILSSFTCLILLFASIVNVGNLHQILLIFFEGNEFVKLRGFTTPRL
jgi:hypothetical protein